MELQTHSFIVRDSWFLKFCHFWTRVKIPYFNTMTLNRTPQYRPKTFYGRTISIYMYWNDPQGSWIYLQLGYVYHSLTMYWSSRSRSFHLYGDVTIAGEGLQNLGLCSALRAFEQGGIFTVPHLLWHGTSVLPVSYEGPPRLVAFYDTRGDVEDLF
jgi:hypothetical protein